MMTPSEIEAEPMIASLSLEDKMELSLILCEIALRCKNCSILFKQAIQDYIFNKKNHLEGGPSIGSSRLTEGNYNENNII